jgi:hypothetical protein
MRLDPGLHREQASAFVKMTTTPDPAGLDAAAWFL